MLGSKGLKAATIVRRAVIGAAALVCLGFLPNIVPAGAKPNIAPPAKPATSTPVERLHVNLSPSDPTTLLMGYSGEVEAGMADAIAKAFAVHKAATKRVVLRLNSGGGSVKEGRRVIDVLREIRKTHQLDTWVKAGTRCGSMCVPIYLQGQKRYASPSSLWLFHEVSVHDKKTDKILRLDRESFQKLVDDYFVPAGVAPEWIAAMMRNTAGSDYWRTGEALIRDKSNIVLQTTSDVNKRHVGGQP